MRPRFSCCENYLPQFLSFTVGAVALPLASVRVLVGQFWSALEFHVARRDGRAVGCARIETNFRAVNTRLRLRWRNAFGAAC
ncbi:hypothetical protein [Mesorhizobium sp. M8A.F.Ca.ET.142.01.1.1]|uniref:hypothetical protein n=1 Tax=Mesorhizobium sp. M8A.F.Ca.ET.142.01.1.1 TaxID=2563958 RepID=UPI001AED138D|nr:hypothetical protein [Mesorhizobium sp. M8A.F.Ca.ET.142.01.1.1]